MSKFGPIPMPPRRCCANCMKHVPVFDQPGTIRCMSQHPMDPPCLVNIKPKFLPANHGPCQNYQPERRA